jgi:Rieske Fe-S protein
MPEQADVSRRVVLAGGAGLAGIAALTLAGCGSSAARPAASAPATTGSTATTSSTDTGSPSSPASSAVSAPMDIATPAAPATPTAAAAPASSAPPTGALAKVSDVPINGSIAAKLNGAPITLARPSANTVAAFSAICTHQGCAVNAGGSQLHCPCHGSIFDALTGAVVQGPASRPLPAVKVSINNGYIVPS